MPYAVLRNAEVVEGCFFKGPIIPTIEFAKALVAFDAGRRAAKRGVVEHPFPSGEWPFEVRPDGRQRIKVWTDEYEIIEVGEPDVRLSEV
jgi:hypothetical protein